LLTLIVATMGCSEDESNAQAQGKAPGSAQSVTGKQDDPGPVGNARVSFIELGSERCIPCIRMQAVMQQIQDRYSDQVRIVFYDVWTPDGQSYARQYGIRVIPTQVFLDAEGQEYFRHEGYFPLSEVAKILSLKGVR
jgi:thioredoxin 1